MDDLDYYDVPDLECCVECKREFWSHQGEDTCHWCATRNDRAKEMFDVIDK